MKNSFRTAPPCRLQPLALAALVLLLPATLRAQQAVLPNGLSVVRGQATVNTAGSRMTVTNSDRAILNWQGFSVGAGSAVRFEQPNAASQVLNRVLGNDPSNILGSLSSNGRVWLLNPNGVLFGQGARIDVAGLVVSTLHVNDADWLGARYNFSRDASRNPEAGIVNQGELRTTTGGQVVLLGSSVSNQGLIEAPGGQVLLAAGQSIELGDTHAPNLAVRVTAPEGSVLNLGQVLAPGGRIDLQAAMVNQQGIVRAEGIGQGAGGQVLLQASQALNVAAGSTTSASGHSGGGQVTLDGGSAGTTLVAGGITASGSAGPGGQVKVLGHHVGLLDAARIDATGATGGGQVLVGGGLQGRDASVPNAEATFMAPGASIDASATQHGNGGRIILWSDLATRAYGTLLARGGPLGGDGGLIETSGGWLDARPVLVSATAAAGRAGVWLLDPNDITIVDSGNGDLNITGNPDFTTTGNSATIAPLTIETALNAGNNVTITTGSPAGHSQAGDITMTSQDIFAAPNTPVILSLLADRNITLDNSTIASSGAALTVNLTAARAGGVGGVSLIESDIFTRGGSITIGGQGVVSGPAGTPSFTGAVGHDASPFTQTSGVNLVDSTLDTTPPVDGPRTDRITINGASQSLFSSTVSGVAISSSLLVSRDIEINGWVQSQGERNGVLLENSSLQAAHGITIRGTAYSVSDPLGIDGNVTAVNIVDSDLQLSLPTPDNTAAITIDGSTAITGNPSDERFTKFGVQVRGGALLLADNGATITVRGSIQSPDAGDASVYLQGDFGSDSALIEASGASALTIQGTGTSQQVRIFGASVAAPNGGTLDVSSTDVLHLSFFDSDGSNVITRITGEPSAAALVAGGTLRIDGDTEIDFSTGTGSLTLQAAGNLIIGGTAPDATRILSAGRMRVLGDNITLNASTQIASSAEGDAIVLAGPNSQSASSFVNNAGSTALATPSDTGRWLIFATNPGTPLFERGNLDHAFRVYDAPFGAAQLDGNGNVITPQAGNGLLFDIAAPLTLAGTPSKVYDGTTALSLAAAGVSLTGGLFTGDRAELAPGTGGNFDSKDAGNRSFTVDSNAFLFFDAQDKPVYGYTTPALAGTITRAPLVISTIEVANKVYDGNTAATVTGITLSGLAGTETLASSATGTFNDKNVSTEKPVAVLVTLADGSNGGLAANYTVEGVTTSADITPKPVTVGTVTAANKVYDGTLAASVSAGGITGLVGAETLATSASGLFADKNGGTSKTVNVNLSLADGGNGGLADNYVLGNPAATTTADITPRALTLGSLTVANKVYDGTLAASVSAGALVGLVEGEALGISASGSFDSKAVGNNKPVNVTVALADGAEGALASNYTLNGPLQGAADITPRTVFASAFVAADKVYDTSRTATVTGWTLGGAVAGDVVTATTASAEFETAGVGAGKVVNAVPASLAGADAGNYLLNAATVQGTASILPALLIYNANPATMLAGATLPPLSGSVSGLVGGETLAGATLGTLVFTTPATPQSLVGLYAIEGSGLSAANYVFAQAEGNATALSVVPATPDTNRDVAVALAATYQQLLPVALPSSPSQGRVLDALLAVQPGPSLAFQSVPVGNMSQEALEALLASRDRLKKNLFAEAILQLEKDPGLADAPPCQAVEQLETGRCLMSDTLKPQVDAGRTQVAEAAAAAPPATAATPAAAAAPPVPAPAPAPQAALPPTLFPKRTVRSAALPQIERKLAVLIGTDRYADPRIPQLSNAVGDAKAVAAMLESTLGYETVVVENGSKEQIVGALNRLAAEARPNDSVVVYYAGHGELVPATGLGYWQPANADPTRPETWISNRDIGKLMGQVGASQVALISDSCFSGSLVAEERIRATVAALDPNQVLQGKASVVMSSGGNEPVFDSGKDGHSTFSWNLMRVLQQVPTWQAGGNVFERVRFAVARELPQRPQYGAAQQAGHQAGSDYLFEKRELEGVR